MLQSWKRSTESLKVPDEIDWSLTTFEGLRRKQRQEFAALSFEEKLERVEQMGELVEMFEAQRKARQQGAVENRSPQDRPSSS